jgi:hypothetical protein
MEVTESGTFQKRFQHRAMGGVGGYFLGGGNGAWELGSDGDDGDDNHCFFMNQIFGFA